MGIPAVVTAGDLRAARAVYGESKVYLEVEGEPLVARVVEVLQQVPEIDEVYVVGNAKRLEGVFSNDALRARIHKPLRVIGQFRNLFENCWQGYRRLLPGAPPEGRDPVSEADLDQPVLYLSGDLPFATPQEISVFIQRARAADCDYACGLVPKESLVDFLPTDGRAGIEVAYFNMREGRLRQSNLHLARPGRMGARHLIEEMYEHRHQKQFGNMIALGWRIMMHKGGGFAIAFWYSLIHLSGLFDRWHLRRLADLVRRVNTLARTERAVSGLLQTRYRFVVTEAGGCAIDVDTEHEYDAVLERYREWRAAQQERAEALYGPPALPATAAGAAGGKRA